MRSRDAQVILGNNVARLRKERGLTQEALADRTDLHSVMISRVERGATDARISTVARIAHGLDVSPALLLEGS